MQEIRHSNKILLSIFLKSDQRVKSKEATSYHPIFSLYRNNLKCWSVLSVLRLLFFKPHDRRANNHEKAHFFTNMRLLDKY